jgi:hypothetical protein
MKPASTSFNREFWFAAVAIYDETVSVSLFASKLYISMRLKTRTALILLVQRRLWVFLTLIYLRKKKNSSWLKDKDHSVTIYKFYEVRKQLYLPSLYWSSRLEDVMGRWVSMWVSESYFRYFIYRKVGWGWWKEYFHPHPAAFAHSQPRHCPHTTHTHTLIRSRTIG